MGGFVLPGGPCEHAEDAGGTQNKPSRGCGLELPLIPAGGHGHSQAASEKTPRACHAVMAEKLADIAAALPAVCLEGDGHLG